MNALKSTVMLLILAVMLPARGCCPGAGQCQGRRRTDRPFDRSIPIDL